MSRWFKGGLAGLLAAGLAILLLADPATGQNKWKGKWTDPDAADLPADFKVQGEYKGAVKEDGRKLGCQVIALGDGKFQAVVYPGGLPGDDWDGKNKVLMDGALDGTRATFGPPRGKKRYLAKKPEEFSATSKFPPAGQKDHSATIENGTMTGKTADGSTFTLKRQVRKSPTLGQAPPKGAKAIVLFDGTDRKEWTTGRVDPTTKWLNTDGHDIRTKRKFNNYSVHVEFLLPYCPADRGQGRGNSGFYQVDMYEVQILDSFGLDGKNNECGGIYSLIAPRLNMCLPPLQWQTYDIDFTNAVPDPDDPKKKLKNTRITVKLNGAVIHDDVEIKGKTGGARADPEGTPGPLQLQGHGNPLQFRNIWIVEKN
jgi:hypothetical protein